MKAGLWIIEGFSLIFQPETNKFEQDMRRMIIFILLILGLLTLTGYLAMI